MARVVLQNQSWSQSNNSSYRDWVLKMHHGLIAAGLVQTSDTGQFDFATAPLPAAYGYSAPLIYRFNDGLQATAPIYIRIRTGSGYYSNTPNFVFAVGSGTDGSGNLNGVVSDEMRVSTGSTVAGSRTDYQCLFSHCPGMAVMVFMFAPQTMTGGFATANIPPFGFCVQRTCDVDGVPTGDGVMIISPGTNIATNSTTADSINASHLMCPLRWTNPTGIAPISTSWLGQVNGAVLDSRVGLSPQAFLHWIMMPAQKPLVGTCFFLRGEVPARSEIGLKLVGSVPRNYLSLGAAFGYVGSAAGATDLAVLWED